MDLKTCLRTFRKIFQIRQHQVHNSKQYNYLLYKHLMNQDKFLNDYQRRMHYIFQFPN